MTSRSLAFVAKTSRHVALIATGLLVGYGGGSAAMQSANARTPTLLRPQSRPIVPGASGASKEDVLHSFAGRPDGAYPYAGLISDTTGALYGTTSMGGDGPCISSPGGGGCGAVFKLAPSGSGYTESVLYGFQDGSDGGDPEAGLLAAANGVLFGTTAAGGATAGNCASNGCGTVFKVAPSGSVYTESVIYRFGYGSTGAFPRATLISDNAGALYGTTPYSNIGAGNGIVFKLTPLGSTYSQSVLHAFVNPNDGSQPFAGLIVDKAGALYGTTSYGGGSDGGGTVFKLTPSGSKYVESVLHRFRGGSDGETPYAGVIADTNGTLFGTTAYGGGGPCKLFGTFNGCGTVFKLTPSRRGYTESVLHRFQGGNDGEYPYAGLIADATGALYGTTANGGNSGCTAGSCGTIFTLVRTRSAFTERILYRFNPGNDGSDPYASLIVDGNGALYGTTVYGGAYNRGTVFRLKP